MTPKPKPEADFCAQKDPWGGWLDSSWPWNGEHTRFWKGNAQTGAHAKLSRQLWLLRIPVEIIIFLVSLLSHEALMRFAPKVLGFGDRFGGLGQWLMWWMDGWFLFEVMDLWLRVVFATSRYCFC